MPRIVYSPRYNIRFYGLERLHPFDSKKYGRAWKLLKDEFRSTLKPLTVRPKRVASETELQLIHSRSYLEKLRDSQFIANALELPPLGRLPAWLINWHVLRPMRWATRGTIVAAEQCLQHEWAINLGGGFHHAKPNNGEGFCVYADIGIAVAHLRANDLIAPDSQVVYIDTDAHQGNGVCHTFADDNRAVLFDMYNSHIYPAHDLAARQRIDCDVALSDGCEDDEYLMKLKSRLPAFLDSVISKPVGIAIYNAGTDVLAGDPLGRLKLTPKAILARDLFVMQQLLDRGFPTLVLPSGGYTDESHALIARSVSELLKATT